MDHAALPCSSLRDSDQVKGFWTSRVFRTGFKVFLAIGTVIVIAALVWQGLTANGSPDPTQPHTSPTVAVLDVAVLVFREGLECVLVLSAITAGMAGSQQSRRRPVAAGAAVGFVATLLTWIIAVGIVSDLSRNIPALQLQAATGLLAVVVLLVVMNWFFHKVYWGGWISFQNRAKKNLLTKANESTISERGLLLGLGLLGFASLYREGFEVVLFLQSYYLQLGGHIVLLGAFFGLILSAFVAILTFIGHTRLPYRKMLVSTGVMLGFVLLVMVGEQAQEMQLAHWLPTTKIAALENMPDWMGVWFSVFPTFETLVAQLLAALLVVGSFFVARRQAAQAH
jgi:high-affinity iron transporter